MNLRELLFLKAAKGNAVPKYVNLLNTLYYGKQVSSKAMVIESGSVEDTSVGSGSSDYILFEQGFPAGTYTLNVKTSGSGISSVRLLCNNAFSGGTYNAYYEAYYADITDNKITFTVDTTFSIGLCFKTLTMREPGKIYDIMFAEGTVALPYSPYIPVNLLNVPYNEKIVGSHITLSEGTIDDSAVGGGNSNYVIFAQTFSPGTYTISCKTTGEGASAARFICSTEFSGGTYVDYYSSYIKDLVDGKLTVKINEESTIGLCVKTGVENEAGTIYDIMFENGNAASDYVPYDVQNLNFTAYRKLQALYGVTFTRQRDGSIALSGEPDGNYNMNFPATGELERRFLLKAGTYTLSGSGGFDNKVIAVISLFANPSDKSAASNWSTTVTGDPRTFAIQNDMWAIVRISVDRQATNIDGRVLKIMLNKLAIADPYKKTNVGKNIAQMTYGKVPSTSTGQEVDAYGFRSDYIKLKHGVTYCVSSFSCDTNYVLFYDENKNFYGGWSVTGFNPSKPATFTPANDCYVRLRSDSQQTFPFVQLEIASVPTTYEPYVEM